MREDRFMYKMRLAFVFSKLHSMFRPRVGDKKKYSRRKAFDEIAYQVFGIEELSTQVLYATNFKRAVEVAEDINFDELFTICDDPQYCEYFIQTIRMYLDINKLRAKIQQAQENNRYPSSKVESEYKELKAAYKKALKILQKRNGNNEEFEGHEVLGRYGELGKALNKKKKRRWDEDTLYKDSEDEYDWDENFDDEDPFSFTDLFEGDDEDELPREYRKPSSPKPRSTNFGRYMNNRGYSPRESYSRRKKRDSFDLDDDDEDPASSNKKEKNTKNDSESKLETVLEKLINVLSSLKGDNNGRQAAAANTQYQQQQVYSQAQTTIPPYRSLACDPVDPSANILKNVMDRVDKLEKGKKKKKTKEEKRASKLKAELKQDYLDNIDLDDGDGSDYVYPIDLAEMNLAWWERLYERGERRLSELFTAFFDQFSEDFQHGDEQSRKRLANNAAATITRIYRMEGVIEDYDLNKALAKARKKVIGPEKEEGAHRASCPQMSSASKGAIEKEFVEREKTQHLRNPKNNSNSTTETMILTETMQDWFERSNSISEDEEFSGPENTEPENVIQIDDYNETIYEPKLPKNTTVDDFNDQ